MRRLILACLLLLATTGSAEAGYETGCDAITPLPLTGKATYYAPGVMQRVVANRLKWRQIAPCQECVGYVALLRPADIGRKVWLQAGDVTIGPLLVVDCATPWDYRRLKDDWAVDVSWEIGRQLNMRGPITVTVYEHDPRTE